MADTTRITNRDELRAWLQGKPRPWARAIAVRAALRVLPTIGRILATKFMTNERRQRLIVAMARANFVSTAVLLQPNRDTIAAAKAAADAAYAAKADAAKADDAIAAAANAAYADAAYAANAYAAKADDTIAAIAANAANAAAAAAAANAADAAYAAVWRSVSSDTSWLEATDDTPIAQRAIALLRQPLWPGNAPKGLGDAWNRFARSPFAAEHGFQPWIQWYEALVALDGKSPPRFLFSDALTLRIAAQPDDWWKRPALAINTDVATWLRADDAPASTATADDAPPEDLIQALDALPGQQPAPYQFDWRDGRMEVLPPDALPEDDGLAQDYLDEVREKTETILADPSGNNIRPDIHPKVRKLRDVLTELVADLRPARVDSRTITIEKLFGELKHSPDAADLPPSVLRDLDDLAETARRLCQCLPGLWKRNLEGLASSLTPNSAATLLTTLNALRDGIKNAEIIGPDVVAAFDALADECAEAADETLKKFRTAMFGLTARNFLNACFQVGKSTSSNAANATLSFAKELIKFSDEVRGNIRPEAAKLVAKGIIICTVGTAAVAALYVTNYGPIREIVRFFPELERVANALDMLRSGTIPPPTTPPPARP
jgi:hypothetical protein